MTPGALEELEATLPVLVLSGRWDSLFAPGVRRRLETDLLPAYLSHQRWFGGRHAPLSIHLLDYGVLQAVAPPTYLVLIEVTYAQGGAETYTLLLSISSDEAAKTLLQTDPTRVLARVRSRQGEGLLHDAVGTEAAEATLLLTLMHEQHHLTSAAGEFRAFVTGPTSSTWSSRGALAYAPGTGEQSNSSIIYGSRMILKFVRRVEAGIHPELDMGRYLTEKLLCPLYHPWLVASPIAAQALRL